MHHHRPYQDKTLLSDAEFQQRSILTGPFGAVPTNSGHHPETRILYFLADAKDKPRLLSALQGQSRETAPIFPLQRTRSLGSIELFWTARLAPLLIGAVQFIPDPQAPALVIAHMTVGTKWRRLGVNSRMIDFIKQSFPGRKLIFQDPTSMGQHFMNGY